MCEYKGEPCPGLGCKTQGCAFHKPLAPNPGGGLLPAGPGSSLSLSLGRRHAVGQTGTLPPSRASGRKALVREKALTQKGCAFVPPVPTLPPFRLRGPGAGGRQGRVAPRGRHWPFVTCPAPSRRVLRAARAAWAGRGAPGPPPPLPRPSSPARAWGLPRQLCDIYSRAPCLLPPVSAVAPPAWTARAPSRNPDCTFQPGFRRPALPCLHRLPNSHPKAQHRGHAWEASSDSPI